MAFRTLSLALVSVLAAAACSSSETPPQQTASGSGGSTGGAAPATPQTGGVTAQAGGAGSVGTGGSPANGGSAGGVTGGTGTGGVPTAGAAGAGTAQGGSTGGAGGVGTGGLDGVGTGGVGTGGVGTGGVGTGGVGGGVASGGAIALGGAANGPFVLAWQDDFDSIDSAAWQLQTFTWEGNEAQFSTQNASVANGVLTLALTAAPSGSEKPYLGVEMRSTKTLTYGRVSTRMRFAKGSGVVSSIVLFYTPFPNCDWNEIDIEHLGKSSNSSQLNAMVYTGTPNSTCTTSVTPTQDPQLADLGFNAETDFHVYDIEWTPSGVKYFADGALLHTWTSKIALLKLPANILLTIWASGAPDWAGPLTSSSAPTSAEVDWIRVYDYEPSASDAR